MQSTLFEQRNLEINETTRFGLQNPQMVRVSLGADVLAVKGAMVAYQGSITFNHESAGSVSRMFKKVVSGEDVSLMRVSGQGEVFFASEAGFIYLVDLAGDALSVNVRNLLAFDSAISWDIKRVQGAGMMSSGLYNTVLQGTGTVALHAIGQPVVLDCSTQPTFVDVASAVAWSANLSPQIVSSMNVRSMLRGGSGEAFQYSFHGAGFVVVQPSEHRHVGGEQQKSAGGGLLGELLK